MATIRTLTPAEAEQAVDWAAAEGWNPGLVDLDCFLAQDSGLFLGGFQGDAMLSVIAATRYDPAFGFIGFYIAHPDARGHGHGMAVWRAAMQQLSGRLIGLDGVVAQQANYRKSGFQLACNNIVLGGAARVLPAPRGHIVPAVTLPFAALQALDRQVFPAERPDFLRAWIAAPGHVALALVEDGVPIGYGVIRPARTGHKIGPLVAPTEADAEALVAALLERADPGEIFLDVPEAHRAGTALATRLGLKPVFETARMYTGAAPPVAMDRLFGITTFELG
jgi:GNAT superfamily N-acetyltransferase